MTTVGRIYLEDSGGYVAQLDYAVPSVLRSAVIRWDGASWQQRRRLDDGSWVYGREPGVRGALDPTPHLTAVGAEDPRWVRPGDLPPIPDPHQDALLQLDGALAALSPHDPVLVKAIQLVIAAPLEGADGG